MVLRSTSQSAARSDAVSNFSPRAPDIVLLHATTTTRRPARVTARRFAPQGGPPHHGFAELKPSSQVGVRHPLCVIFLGVRMDGPEVRGHPEKSCCLRERI